MARGPKTSLTVTMHISGVRETLAALRQLPKDAAQELRQASLDISTKLAYKARATASDTGPQGSLLAQTVKAVRDRVPAVQAGGTKRVGRNNAFAYKVLFGHEFGSNAYAQFQKAHSSLGYWLFPLIDREQFTIEAEFNEAADAILAKFGKGGQ